MENEQSKGKLTILIGPNGFGKTRILNDIYSKNKKECILIPTELKWSDEIKDTTNKPITMDVILNDIILPNKEVNTAREEFEKKIQKVVNEYLDDFKKITDKMSKFNGIGFPRENILQQSKEIQYSSLIGLEKSFVKYISSGMGMCFILELLKFSTRKEILLDEPEKFCHPSLLPQIATYIDDLLNLGKNVTLATHSPNLVKKLDWSFENLGIVNEFEKNVEKEIKNKIKYVDLDLVINDTKVQEISKVLISNGSADRKLIGDYIADKEKLGKYLHYRKDSIIDLLFSKNLYLVEGENDLIFLRYLLKKQDEPKDFIEDYEILKLDGKFFFPVFIFIFNQIKNSDYMQIFSMFDTDDQTVPLHEKTNTYIRENSSKYLEFSECLEIALGFAENKQDNNNKKNDCVQFINFLETELLIRLEEYIFIKNS